MKKITIYTDGACSYNPGPGGFGVVLLYNGHKKELSGYDPMTTNNRMELMAVITALECLRESCEIDLYTDSKYVADAFNKNWTKNWQRNGWKTASKKPVENQDLWLRLLAQVEKNQINWLWVKGHADNEYNERCDQLARKEIESRMKK
ncbi:MAG: ribonuclease HI [Christensenellaceae bacterium]|nr:ribonuclease HI [Christensenellaceae bacterium]MBR3842577.1 ribonuclease HI [Christensenellaceae bacterium]